jgi:hypothetical protein
MADESKRAAINATLPIVFSAIDANHDNGVSPAEFHNYFVSLGVTDESFTQSVFAAMDSNNDGDLSSEGYILYLYFNLIIFFNYFQIILLQNSATLVKNFS